MNICQVNFPKTKMQTHPQEKTQYSRSAKTLTEPSVKLKQAVERWKEYQTGLSEDSDSSTDLDIIFPSALLKDTFSSLSISFCN